MATNINQKRDDEKGVTTLQVTGEMFYDDGVLLEKIANCIREESGDRIVIDLADLDLIDSDAAPFIRRMCEQTDIEIVGMEIFRQTIVDDAERSGL
jgi:anti-anti-sigma regulatory factor